PGLLSSRLARKPNPRKGARSMNRSPTTRHAQALLVLLIVSAGFGCSGISVTRSNAPDLQEAWRNSIIRQCRVSPRTEQTLRHLDLTSAYDANPDRGAAQLHALALQEPQPDVLFALAEINYLQGRKLESWKARDAIGHYYLCAGYAYHYLFATADRNQDLE